MGWAATVSLGQPTKTAISTVSTPIAPASPRGSSTRHGLATPAGERAAWRGASEQSKLPLFRR